ncbi:MAG: leucyl aminopeptidase [Anaerolineae bacterium]|jgi:leucyl aminopeptidase|nr:leucyl aminopeptidase [Anaerolineae bacterium]
MDIRVLHDSITAQAADTLLLYLMEDGLSASPEQAAVAVDAALGGALRDLLDGGDFSGKAGTSTVLYPRGALPARRVIVMGLGPAADFTAEGARRAAAAGLQKARSLKAQHVATVTPGTGRGGLSVVEAVRAVVEGGLNGLYQYHGQKSSEPPAALPHRLDVLVYAAEELPAAEHGLHMGRAFAAGSALARDLVNLPPNICTPAYLAEVALNVGAAHNLKVTVLERGQMQALKMGALLGVAQGSDTPPRFIIMEHRPEKTDGETLVLVGKGVTFDTGGYTLKPGDGMIGMKGDMSGGAAVIGAMLTIARLRLPLRVVGLIPAADNMVSGSAYRPQDVLTASNGKTIEIISTDAEGRLLLADALVYAGRYQPAAVVDIATLTGAMNVALGGAAAGVYCTDERLMTLLNTAGENTQERVWRMPLYADYARLIESDTADMKNSAGFQVRGGGAGVAASFLKHFVDYPAWAHIDMAGKMLADGENPYLPKGATGYGARLLAELARLWSG